MLRNIETFTDADLVQMICGQKLDRERALHYIFVHSGWLKEVMSGLRHQGVALQDANDAIQEALITLDKHVRSGSFDRTKPLKQYFWGICKGRAYSNNRSKKRINDDGVIPEEVISDTPETEMLKIEKKDIIRRLLNQLDETCRDLLSRYMLSFSMKEIKEEMQIVSDAMTRKKAHDCRQKLANMIDNNPTIKRYLKN